MKRAIRFVGPFGYALLIVFALAGSALAISQIKRYEKPPAIDLKDLDGNRVTSESLKGQPAILVFGELYNRNTIRAIKELETVRIANGFGKTKLPIYLIVAQNAKAADLRASLVKKNVQATVLHDPYRTAFGDYGVVAIPSVVVLDGKGNVCTAISGYPLAFADFVTDAIKFALGELTRKQFEAAGKVTSRPAMDESRVRAGRLAGLARQLFRRGLSELALDRYKKALELDPGHLPARVGLSRCLIRLNRLDQAGEQLHKALTVDKKNLEANLAMAYVEILRGGDETAAARKRLDRVLLFSPHSAEGHYLMGLVHETQKEISKALAEFKKAAEMLLEMKVK